MDGRLNQIPFVWQPMSAAVGAVRDKRMHWRLRVNLRPCPDFSAPFPIARILLEKHFTISRFLRIFRCVKHLMHLLRSVGWLVSPFVGPLALTFLTPSLLGLNSSPKLCQGCCLVLMVMTNELLVSRLLSDGLHTPTLVLPPNANLNTLISTILVHQRLDKQVIWASVFWRFL